MAAGRSSMALREFEQVRERIALCVEVRTIVQTALAVLALIVAAFAAGYLLGREAMPTPAPAPQAPVPPSAPTPAAVHGSLAAPEAAQILPKPLRAEPVADPINTALLKPSAVV